MMPPPRTQSGFSLIELVVVITLLGILGGVVGSIIGNFVGGITTGIGRQETASAGRTAMERMVREIRSGLPNSFRALNGGELNGSDDMAFIRVAWTGRYQATGPNSSRFRPGETGDEFLAYAPGDPPSDADFLSIYPVSWADLNNGSSAAELNTVSGSCDSGNGCSLELASGASLEYHSPGRRVYAAEKLVCLGMDSNKVWMNEVDVSVPPNLNDCTPTAGGVLVDNVDSTEFTFNPGSPTRSALVHVELTLQNPSSTDEKLDFVQDIHALNPP